MIEDRSGKIKYNSTISSIIKGGCFGIDEAVEI